ncbi:MAG TPA: acyl-CoA synthetase [Rhodobacteraceae bacterium]|nr:acetate--CoA ligase family protein [Paracoccaceae bacterium]HBR61616.1 acyl-CoA synthetase [Paracoccaceae bacterium]
MLDLSRLLRPRSVAVIGGGVWCENVVQQCRAIGFRGAIWPVHPTRAEIAGVPVFAGLAALPSAPDAVFIGVNRTLTVQLVAQLAEMGAGGATCFASGFREAQLESADGADLQEQLLLAAKDMPVIGPNCYGFINYLDGVALWPDQHGGLQVDCGVAIVTQSSNVAINLTMQSRALPLAYVVTVGNQAQTGLAQIGQALLDDPRVTVLGLYIEGVGDLRAFEALAAQARRMGKPIVALKTGRSPQARAGAVSHTASLAGSGAGARALFARLGVAEVTGLDAFLETLKLLHVTGALPSRRIASLSCSGGEASLMADSALDLNLEFPPLTKAQKTALRTALGPMVALANPLDYHTYIWGDVAAMTATFSALLGDDLALSCIVVDFPRADRCDPAAWDCVVTAAVAAKKGTGVQTGGRLALVSSLPETMPETVAQKLIAQGIVPLCGIESALKAIEIAADIGQMQAVPPQPLLLPEPVQMPQELRHGHILNEHSAKARLLAHGVPVPEGRFCASAKLAAQAAKTLGFPLVLKGMGHAHKSEAGAVHLNLRSSQAVAQAAADMDSNGYLLEQMVTGGVAEVLVAVLRDPAHGFVLTLGAGGVMTEILADVSTRLVPVTAQDVRAALAELRIYPVLCGYRGSLGVNIDALIQAVLGVQSFVLETAAFLEEVEINPLICTPDRAVAVDALITLGVSNDRDTN